MVHWCSLQFCQCLLLVSLSVYVAVNSILCCPQMWAVVLVIVIGAIQWCLQTVYGAIQIICLLLLLLFWPRYSIPREWKNYAMQYKKVQKSSWNEPYSSSFTKQSCSKMALYLWIRTESGWYKNWFLCDFVQVWYYYYCKCNVANRCISLDTGITCSLKFWCHLYFQLQKVYCLCKSDEN